MKQWKQATSKMDEIKAIILEFGGYNAPLDGRSLAMAGGIHRLRQELKIAEQRIRELEGKKKS